MNQRNKFTHRPASRSAQPSVPEEDPWIGTGAKVMIILIGVVVFTAWGVLLYGITHPV